MHATDTRMGAWRERYATVCQSPLEPVSISAFAGRHPVKEFERLWLPLPRHEHALPARRDLSNDVLAGLDRWQLVFTVESVDAQHFAGFQVCEQGAAAVELTHGDLTGRFLDEYASDECLESRLSLMTDALMSRDPRFATLNVEAKVGWATDQQIAVGYFPFAFNRTGYQIVAVITPQDATIRSLL